MAHIWESAIRLACADHGTGKRQGHVASGSDVRQLKALLPLAARPEAAALRFYEASP